jgi:ribosome biogenesis GTPase A
MIEDLRRHRQRPCIRVLNKADLADPEATAQWVRAIAEATAPGDRVQSLPLCAHRPADIARLPRLAQSLAPHRDGPLKPLRLMVMGIPNVGKSTLINALARRKVAAVGDEPAVTRHEQRIDVNERLVLFDTPGLMWPLIEHASDGLMLAASHAIGVNAYIDEEVATFLAEVLLARYRARLEQRYALGHGESDGPGVIEAVAVRRGLLLRGGVPDLGKAARALLADYRSGALGRVSLETPASRVAMIAADRAARAAVPPDDEASTALPE